jgi:NlpC/P60 family putative phage cell wall peptidase
MQLVAEARSWLKTPYHRHASLKGVGCDCLGLHRGIGTVFGIVFQEASHEVADILRAPQWFLHLQEEYFLDVFATCPALEPVPLDAVRPGDALLFGFGDHPCSHAGVLTTPARFVHALYGKEVREDPLVPHWSPFLRAAFAVKGVIDDAP